MRYECWGDDHEDLTQKVEEELANGGTVTFGVTGSIGRPRKSSPRKVLVICSKGHENVFIVED